MFFRPALRTPESFRRRRLVLGTHAARLAIQMGQQQQQQAAQHIALSWVITHQMTVTRSCRRTRVAGRALQHYDVPSLRRAPLFLCSDRANAMMPNRSQTYIQTSRSNSAGSSTGVKCPRLASPADEYSTMRLSRAVTGRQPSARIAGGEQGGDGDTCKWASPLGPENVPSVLLKADQVGMKPARHL